MATQRAIRARLRAGGFASGSFPVASHLCQRPCPAAVPWKGCQVITNPVPIKPEGIRMPRTTRNRRRQAARAGRRPAAEPVEAARAEVPPEPPSEPALAAAASPGPGPGPSATPGSLAAKGRTKAPSPTGDETRDELPARRVAAASVPAPHPGVAGEAGATSAGQEGHREVADRSPTHDQLPRTQGLLAALLSELQAAPAEQLAALRRAVAVVPDPPVPERRRGERRRTYAFYLSEAVGEAIKRQAQVEGVPPSEIAERLLRRAQATGWLPQ